MGIGLSAPCWHGGHKEAQADCTAADPCSDTPRCKQESADRGMNSAGTLIHGRRHSGMGIDSLSGTRTGRDTEAHACSDYQALQMK